MGGHGGCEAQWGRIPLGAAYGESLVCLRPSLKLGCAGPLSLETKASLTMLTTSPLATLEEAHVGALP